MTSKFVSGLAIAAIASTAFVGVAAADDIASGGNGGVSTSNANGGPVSIGSTNTGGTSGSIVQAALDEALVSGDDIAAAVIAAIFGTSEE
ncbi:MAG: hypothetical protein M3Q50_04760 [Chloroflexota bacterium]|nr:hypothetical protein [Chloroflexia bacterium]MDQ3225925.1 hypothetical protein [Chloroflexota bacterium]